MHRRYLLGVSLSVGAFVAALLSSEVLLRASWLLRPGFDPTAFLVRYGSGPLVGLGLVASGFVTFCVCRALVERSSPPRLAGDGRSDASALRSALAPLAKGAAVGTGTGLGAGAFIAWLSLRADGMGNGGDTRILRFEILDFVQASALGIAVFLFAAVSEVARSQVAVAIEQRRVRRGMAM